MGYQPDVATADKHTPEGRIQHRWLQGNKMLLETRKNYWLNYAFLRGQQWVRWNEYTSSVQQVAGARYQSERVQVTVNKMGSRTTSVMSRMLQRDLVFEAAPTAADDVTMEAAKLGEFVLEAARQDHKWESVRTNNLYNTLCGGVAAVQIKWDPNAGQSWLNPDSGQIQPGGEIELVPLSIAEFTMEPGSRTWPESRYFISLTAATPEQTRDKWNLPDTPKADAFSFESPIQQRLLFSRGFAAGNILTNTYELWERPNAMCPKGEHSVMVNQKIVFTEPWPFPFSRLPIQLFHQSELPMEWTGHTFLTAARPVQVAYNAIRSYILEHAKLASTTRIIAPHGALADSGDLTDEPGEIIEYYEGAGGKPEYMAPPPIPRSLAMEAQNLEAELDDIMFTHDVTRGVAPGDRNSGLAIATLSEKDDTPLGIMARNQADGWGHIGSMVLDLYAANVKEERTAVIKIGKNANFTLKWDGKMFRDQTRVTVPLDTVSPHSRTSMMAMITSLAQSFPNAFQGVDASVLTRMMELPQQGMLEDAMDPDYACAQRENTLMAAGTPKLPTKWHDHAKHIAQHNAFRNSAQYEGMSPEMQAMYEDHVQAHQRLIEEEAAGQAQVNSAMPGMAALPQAHNPIGSDVPPPLQMLQGGQSPTGKAIAS